MFKLLKFIDEYKQFQKGFRDFSLRQLSQATKSLILRREFSDRERVSVFENLFLLISKFSSTLYYLLDNTNLLLNAIFGRKHKHKKVIKRWKDWFNLIRNWFQLFRSIEKVRKASNLLDEMEAELR